MKTSKRIRTNIFLAVTFIITAIPNPVLAENSISITTDGNSVSVHSDHSPLLLYSYNNVPFKPYILSLIHI